MRKNKQKTPKTVLDLWRLGEVAHAIPEQVFQLREFWRRSPRAPEVLFPTVSGATPTDWGTGHFDFDSLSSELSVTCAGAGEADDARRLARTIQGTPPSNAWLAD